eukprot:jgi/Galph1/4415/GphlegSOOS_G3072.1
MQNTSSSSSALVSSETSCSKSYENVKQSSSNFKILNGDSNEPHFFCQILKDLLYEFRVFCLNDQELLNTLPSLSVESISKRSRLALLLQGRLGYKQEIFYEILKLEGAGPWQEWFETSVLGAVQQYGSEKLCSLLEYSDTDEELSNLISKHKCVWESELTLLPLEVSEPVLALRKKRELFGKRIETCVSIIIKLSRKKYRNANTATSKIDQLKLRLKKLQNAWEACQERETRKLEKEKLKKRKEEEKEQQRLAREYQKREERERKEEQREKRKAERNILLQQKLETQRIMEMEKQKKVIEKEIKLHKQAAGRKPHERLPWLNYEYDSDAEWIESDPGESVSDSLSEDDESGGDVDSECSNDSFVVADNNERIREEEMLASRWPMQEEIVGIFFSLTASLEDNENYRQYHSLYQFPVVQLGTVIIGDNSCDKIEVTVPDGEHAESRKKSQVPEKQVTKTLYEFWRKKDQCRNEEEPLNV